MPCTTPAPSKAGPAEQAQAMSQVQSPSTISPLVPMSTKRVRSPASHMLELTTPDVMSAPT